MKKNSFYNFFLILVISGSVMAAPGKQEFKVLDPDGELRFINDSSKMVILKINKTGYFNQSSSVQCGIAPIKNNSSTFGPNTVTFHKDYATVNGKTFTYLDQKTDLFPLYDVCPKSF